MSEIEKVISILFFFGSIVIAKEKKEKLKIMLAYFIRSFI